MQKLGRSIQHRSGVTRQWPKAHRPVQLSNHHQRAFLKMSSETDRQPIRSHTIPPLRRATTETPDKATQARQTSAQKTLPVDEMEQVKPWHSFRLRGLCSLRSTTCIMTSIICATVFYLAAELAQEVKSYTPVADITENDTDHQRVKRSTITLVTPTHGSEDDVITIMEGSSVRFNCNPFLRNCPYCGRPEYEGTSSAECAQVYFYEHPCEWGKVKAYTNPVRYGTDGRFRVAKRGRKGHNKDGMSVTIVGMKTLDQGKYYCGIDKPIADWYETFSNVVGKPAPQPVKHLIEPAFEPATKEEMAWMGNEEAVQGKINLSEQKAMIKSQGNKACTLALL
ncbi:hypothetical protein Q8A67_025754 [Cirrhinus molitorella]|uniref:Uncharacterized protein n=1 Tax=Cirrhinus molitorella TaxID=172907 RepID=A0AA88P0T2_9TELE|nr:hypothetical protein Q8A67_025754 [Cirrhinus molitorella]